ncbi:Phosphatidylinositol (PI) 3-kinase [Dimargaris cristalligena]|nr:Phosphatidylinositol (PI) 3-kinase [Dimargaris cristalligena]
MEYQNNAQFKDFSYCLTREVDQFVAVKLVSLEGNLKRFPDAVSREINETIERLGLGDVPSNVDPANSIFATVEIYADGYPLGIPYRTSYRPTKHNIWNEWITLPVKYCDIPLTAQLLFNFWCLEAPREIQIVGGCTLSLFTCNHKLRQGRQKLTLWDGQLADPLSPTQTPGKTGTKTEMDRLEKLIKKHENGDLARLDWLDKLAFREIEKIHQIEARRTVATFLYIELPKFDFPLIYSETESADPYLVTPLFPRIAFVHDPELHRENLAEAKHRRLLRSQRHGPLDRELKPNAKLRDELNTILQYPPTKELNTEEKDLLWKFRFYLARDRKALTKFLRCVAWSDPVESHQAVDLLTQWADIDVDDALELLGPAFTNQQVRAYAVVRLQRADDDELRLYLLQLVQALRFEAMGQRLSHPMAGDAIVMPTATSGVPTVTATTTTTTTTNNVHLANSTHAHFGSPAPPAKSLTGLASSVPGPSTSESGLLTTADPALSHASANEGATSAAAATTSTSTSTTSTSNLAEFLITRAVQSPILGNYFFWYLRVECEDKVVGPMYTQIALQYEQTMGRLPGGAERLDILARQTALMTKLSRLSLHLRQMKEARPQKIAYLQNYLANPKNQLQRFPAPLPLPLDPTVEVVGIIPEKSTVFKSSMLPLSLTFARRRPPSRRRPRDGQMAGSGAGGGESDEDDGVGYSDEEEEEVGKESEAEYRLMFKTGDDLRQDQLVIQIFTLMDRLLRQEKLDLRLTPYKVLATGADQGLIQFIPSSALAQVLTEHNDSVLAYLRLHNPDPRPTVPYGVTAGAMDTYIKSCAGYCVITYLLGVGDRHLDNLLMTRDGRLFHIDFGYFLGRDPKPFPPPMKLCKEMVEGMGGAFSVQYQRFQAYCFVAFSVLRKSANLILNLLALMVEANIPDIAIEPDQAVAKVQEKFRLDLSEEEATQYFQSLINESVSALFPQVIETIHRWAMYWKQ